jgi:hypothetical protein
MRSEERAGSATCPGQLVTAALSEGRVPKVYCVKSGGSFLTGLAYDTFPLDPNVRTSTQCEFSVSS